MSYTNIDALIQDGEPDSLTVHGAHNPSDTSDLLITDGETDSLTPDGRIRVAGVDWDKPRAAKISLAGQDIFGLSPEEFIEWYRNDAAKVCDVICFERPHLRARGDFSRAQIWTASDLERMVGGPPIKMPNGKKLRKMAEYAGNMIEVKVGGVTTFQPDKDKDSESIRRYAEDHPEIRNGWRTFRPPSRDFSAETHAYRDELRREIGRTINEWRELWQDVSGKDAIRALEFVQPVAAILDEVFDDLSDECKAVFKLTRSKGTVNLSQGKTRVMTVYAMAYDKDHNLRTFNGKPLGRRYLMKDVVGLCDSYMPNMARANLTGYGKTGLAGVDSRTKLNKAVKELLRAFQTHADSLILDGKNSLLTLDGERGVGQDPLMMYGEHSDSSMLHGGPGQIFNEGAHV